MATRISVLAVMRSVDAVFRRCKRCATLFSSSRISESMSTVTRSAKSSVFGIEGDVCGGVLPCPCLSAFCGGGFTGVVATTGSSGDLRADSSMAAAGAAVLEGGGTGFPFVSLGVTREEAIAAALGSDFKEGSATLAGGVTLITVSGAALVSAAGTGSVGTELVATGVC